MQFNLQEKVSRMIHFNKLKVVIQFKIVGIEGHK